MNGDEILNAFEFRHVMTGDKASLHLESAKLTHQECDQLFNYLDNDKSGGISWDEFRNFISRYGCPLDPPFHYLCCNTLDCKSPRTVQYPTSYRSS